MRSSFNSRSKLNRSYVFNATVAGHHDNLAPPSARQHDSAVASSVSRNHAFPVPQSSRSLKAAEGREGDFAGDSNRVGRHSGYEPPFGLQNQ